MQKQWITGVVMVGLALVTAPAWAQTCDNQLVLTSAKNAAGLPVASGTAEATVKAATLKSAAVNKFEVNIVASALHPYAVMVNSVTPTGTSQIKMVGGIFTDVNGNGDFDVKGATGTCNLKVVRVVDFLKGVPGPTILSGDFTKGPLDPADPPEVQAEVEIETQLEVQNELHNIANN